MAWASDLIVLFLGLEVLSMALYILAASTCAGSQSQEAGLKYFVLGGFSSAFFLYGIALIYGATGSTNMRQIVRVPRHDRARATTGLLLTGMALLLVGFGFKVAAVPFHIVDARRLPGRTDARSPASWRRRRRRRRFAALLRVFVDRVPRLPRRLAAGHLRAGACCRCSSGSVLAIVQTDVKRMLAYSSISHAGFILVGVDAMADQRANVLVRSGYSALFYLLAYTVIVIGSFGVVMLVGPHRRRRHVARRATGPVAPSPAARLHVHRAASWPRPACRSRPGSSPSST